MRHGVDYYEESATNLTSSALNMDRMLHNPLPLPADFGFAPPNQQSSREDLEDYNWDVGKR